MIAARKKVPQAFAAERARYKLTCLNFSLENNGAS